MDDEQHFMQQLFEGLDAAVFDVPPSQPDPKPKPKPQLETSPRSAPTVTVPKQAEPSQNSLDLHLLPDDDWTRDLSPTPTPAPTVFKPTYTRAQIVGIVHRSYPSNPSASGPKQRLKSERVLVLQRLLPDKQDNSESDLLLALLRDAWLTTNARPTDIVHLVGKFETDHYPLPPRSEWSPDAEAEQEQQEQTVQDEDDLWAELDSLPSLSQPEANIQSQAQTSTLVPAIILASRSEQQQPAHLDNLLILHPDILVPSTKVSNLASCMRKPLIQDRLSGTSETNVSLVMGSMLHELLQACLTAHTSSAVGTPSRKTPSSPSNSPWPMTWSGIGDFSWPYVHEQIQQQVQLNMESLFAVGLDTVQALTNLEQAAALFARFATTYLAAPAHKLNDFHTDAVVLDQRSKTPIRAKITRVYDVEEEIWSPMYGLKGKIDVSILAALYSSEDKQPSVATVMPLEIKTGRAASVAMEHRAQTMLYTLMMSDRYACQVLDGLLYYSKSGEMHRVSRARNETRSLIMGRNELATYMMRSKAHDDVDSTPALPPTIDDEYKCSKCYVADGCMLFRRVVDNVSDPLPDDVDVEQLGDKPKPTPIARMYHSKTGHLTETHVEFFRKWDALLTLEEQDLVRFRRELWTMTAPAREQLGRCFANMRLLPPKSRGGAERTKAMHRFTYRFARNSSEAGGNVNLLSGHISLNDPVTLSIEPRMLSVAQGFVTALTPTVVEIGLDHDIQSAIERADTPAIFRIDRDELAAGMGKIRSNLANLFWAGDAADIRRRDLIVDLREPRFLPHNTGDALSLPPHLNDDQQAAVRKVLAAQDYALVLGMPGTGKTTTIAEIIKLLVKQGKSVLLTSYTHSAVDTILRKLIDVPGVEPLRLGNVDKVHPDTRRYVLGKPDSIEHLETMLAAPNVVATTCLSVARVQFTKRTFDYCIVDEASQITLPTCLGPLRFADKFVLVGDHFQLPPLVRNVAAKKGGLDVSLFRLLSERHPHAMVYLTRQYRMNADIMALSNHLIYDGRLQCGSDAVADQSLSLPVPPSPGLTASPWLHRVLDQTTKVLFLNTDTIPAHESRVGELVQNVYEARIVSSIVRALLSSGVHASSVGVITPYRQQIKLLSSPRLEGVEIMTADRSQGRDKAVVVVSLVRASAAGSTGQLLSDWRRINVAFTRAKMKLVVVGSQSTLSRSSVLKDFLDLMAEKAWVQDVQDDLDRVEAALERQCQSQPQQSKRALLSPQRSPVKRARSVPKGKVSERSILTSRPVLRDIINEIRPAS